MTRLPSAWFLLLWPGLLSGCAETPKLLSGPQLPAELRDLPVGTDAADHLAPEHWTLAALTGVFGAPTLSDGQQIWLLNEHLLRVSFRPDGSPKWLESKRFFDPANPPPGVPVATREVLASWPARLILALTTSDDAATSILGRPSRFGPDDARLFGQPRPAWYFGTSAWRVRITLEDSRNVHIQWSNESARPAVSPTTDTPAPAGPWRLRPPAGRPTTTTLPDLADLMPRGLARGMAFETVVKRLGPPWSVRDDTAEWPGIAIGFDVRGLVSVTLDREAWLAQPDDPATRAWVRALTEGNPASLLGLPTIGAARATTTGDAANWRFDGPDTAGMTAFVRYDPDHARVQWSWHDGTVPTQDCAWLVLPPGILNDPTAAQRWMLAGPWIQTPDGVAPPHCGWPVRGYTRSPMLTNDDTRLRIAPIDASAVRETYPDDPVAGALGETADVWVTRFGPPTRRTDRTLTWHLVADIDDKRVRVHAHVSDADGDGHIDTFSLQQVKSEFDNLVTGLDPWWPAASLALLGAPDSPHGWSAGVCLDPDANILTFASPNIAALVAWLRARGVHGPLFDTLGKPLLDAVAVLVDFGGVDIAYAGDALRVMVWADAWLATDSDIPAIMLTCKGPTFTCERIDMGPHDMLNSLMTPAPP